MGRSCLINGCYSRCKQGCCLCRFIHALGLMTLARAPSWASTEPVWVFVFSPPPQQGVVGALRASVRRGSIMRRALRVLWTHRARIPGAAGTEALCSKLDPGRGQTWPEAALLLRRRGPAPPDSIQLAGAPSNESLLVFYFCLSCCLFVAYAKLKGHLLIIQNAARPFLTFSAGDCS